MTAPSTADVLRAHFPAIATLREGQAEAIDKVTAGRSVACLMPTGGGKSLVYQVAGIRGGGTTLVLSPLVALMKQQAQRLAQDDGLRAISLSELAANRSKYLAELRDWSRSTIPSFLFASPERLAFDGYLEHRLRKDRAGIGLVVIDEAHCISQWGHTFRPAYKAIPSTLDSIFGPDGWPPVLCLTATVGPKDLEEIRAGFRIAEQDVVRTPSLLRTNLTLRCEQHADEPAKLQRLEEILAAHAGEKTLVYVHRKSGNYGTEKLAERFGELGFRSDYFDADRSDEDKQRVLDEFTSGKIPVVFATNAFGLGIDIPDIRNVVHYLIPESIEQYYQEVGRAGRDGEPAAGYLLFCETNLRVRADLIRASLVKRAELEESFADTFRRRGPSPIRSLDPYQSLSDEGGAKASWFELQHAGVLSVRAKGPHSIRCFEVARGKASPEMDRLGKASGTGLTLAIANKLGEPVETVVETVWNLYDQGLLSLKSSPSQMQFFNAPDELPAFVLDTLEASLREKLASRLDGLERLVELVRSGADPTKAVARYLGLPS